MFFTAKRPCEVLWAAVRFISKNDATLSLNLVKCADGIAVDNGSSLLVTPFDLNGTVETVQTRSGFTLTKTGATQLEENDSLGLLRTSTLYNVLHVAVTVYLKYLGNGDYQ